MPANTVVEMLREAQSPLAKLDHPRWRYLTVLELARKLGVDRKRIYYAVERSTLDCWRFGRKIFFPQMSSNELFASSENVIESI